MSLGDRQTSVASACTIVARNYLAQARVLADTYLTHHPRARFYILVVDGPPPAPAGVENLHLLGPEILGLPTFNEMSFKYTVTELCTAVKPTLLEKLLWEFNEPELLYLDPDIAVFRPLYEAFAELERWDIVLTPHLLSPIAFDNERPNEQDILIAGAYNLGFIGLRRTPCTANLLAWWASRLENLCQVNPCQGLMTDQRWVDLVPGLFAGHVGLLLDPSYNVAYWNLNARQLSCDHSGRYLIENRPLAFFHFSGYHPARPEWMSKHQTRFELSPGSTLRHIFDGYGAMLAQRDFSAASTTPYGYATFDDGVGLHDLIRRIYLELPAVTRREYGNPFAASGPFRRWLTASGGSRTLSPLAERIHAVRSDLAIAFPDVYGAQRDSYLRWLEDHGALEMGIDRRLVAAPLGDAQPADATDDGAVALNRTDSCGDQFGVNVCGYLRNESGVGAAARGYVSALRHAGVNVQLKDVSELSVNRSEDDSLNHVEQGEYRHPINLVCINADQHFVVKATDPAFFKDRYNIGVWFWELPSLPRRWWDRFDEYNELWVGSSFIADALAPISPIPVIRVPPPLDRPVPGNRERGRRMLGVDPGTFVVLFVFDFHSYFERKNPLAVVEAYRRALGAQARAKLVIKCVNGHSAEHHLARLASAVDDVSGTLLHGYQPASEVADLMAACDAYLSLHRSEGAGLTIAEAMAAGKPVIATDWSGNTDFMDASNSYPVSFTLEQLTEDIGPYEAGNVWANPSVEHAAALLRHVYDHPDDACQMGRRAAAAIAERLSAEASAAVMAQRLQVISRSAAFQQAQAAQASHKSKSVEVTRRPWGNQHLIAGLRELVAEHCPPGALIAVISKGDPLLLSFEHHVGRHFPATEDGRYIGFHPADSQMAIEFARGALPAVGAAFLLVPETSAWWQTYYGELFEMLERAGGRVAANEQGCLYNLRALGTPAATDDAAPTPELAQLLLSELRQLQQFTARVADSLESLCSRSAPVPPAIAS